MNVEWPEVLTSKLNEVPSIKKKKKKVPADLETRLFEMCDVEEVKFNLTEETSDEEIVHVCKQIFKHLDGIEKRNKGYYYNLGMLLSKLKSRYSTKFIVFVKDAFNRSK